MPEQAILDLPVIDFDLYEGAMPRLHALCIENYGLAGFRPHPDAVFHFSASLWRYRHGESVKQIVGLSTFFLRALTRHVAARRRVAAVRTAVKDHSGASVHTRMAEADEDLAHAQEDLNDVSQLLDELILGFVELKRTDPAEAESRVHANLEAMGVRGWAGRLEHFSRTFAQMGTPRIDWSAGLDEVLEDIEALDIPEDTADSNGSAREAQVDESLIDRLRRELDEYRSIATRASKRLQQVDRERHELERLLSEAETDGDGGSLLQGPRGVVDASPPGVSRGRLDGTSYVDPEDLEQARRQIQILRAERDQLEADLIHALSASTDSQEASEELIERLERSADERENAAETISSLSRRLAEIQDGAGSMADYNEHLQAQVADHERALGELRQELVRSEERLAQANATIHALEKSAGRNNEFEQILTESEERLLETQRRLQEAKLRADGLADELEDREYQLKQAGARIESQKKTIDGVSVQLAEAETLTDEHEARIEALERENERLRGDLSDAQGKMLDARGDADDAHEAARVADRELERLRDTLKEERNRASSISSESAALRRQVGKRAGEVEKLHAEMNELKQRLNNAGRVASEKDAQLRERDRSLEEARAELQRLRAEAEGVRRELSKARGELGDGEAQIQKLEQELHKLKEGQLKATSELNAAKNSASATGAERSRLRAELITLEQRIADLTAAAEAENELAADRLGKLTERLELAKERTRVADAETNTLREALKRAEGARSTERDELQRVIERERGTVSEESGQLKRLQGELAEMRERLNKSDAYILKQEREFERMQSRHDSMLKELGKLAELRADYEEAEGERRDEIASQIARRMDSLFSTAGAPINADRRTEKVVILTLKKSDQEIEAEAQRPFVATKREGKVDGPKASGDAASDAQS